MNSLSDTNRIKWQCRRGMLELDFIFQHFFDHQYMRLSSEKKGSFFQLLQKDDPTLYDWLVANIPCTDTTLQAIVNDVRRSQLSPLL